MGGRGDIDDGVRGEVVIGEYLRGLAGNRDLLRELSTLRLILPFPLVPQLHLVIFQLDVPKPILPRFLLLLHFLFHLVHPLSIDFPLMRLVDLLNHATVLLIEHLLHRVYLLLQQLDLLELFRILVVLGLRSFGLVLFLDILDLLLRLDVVRDLLLLSVYSHLCLSLSVLPVLLLGLQVEEPVLQVFPQSVLLLEFDDLALPVHLLPVLHLADDLGLFPELVLLLAFQGEEGVLVLLETVLERLVLAEQLLVIHLVALDHHVL